MGLMGRILGVGRTAEKIGAAVGGVAEVFVGNAAERDAAAHAERQSSVEQFRGEFVDAGGTGFDGFVDGLNRLPRPLLALGTLGLFVYSMTEPAGFGRRMEGLALVPEPLWWLLGAIVSFYFGARELHYQRVRTVLRASLPDLLRPATERAPASGLRTDSVQNAAGPVVLPAQHSPDVSSLATVTIPADDPDFNPAVEEWRRLGR